MNRSYLNLCTEFYDLTKPEAGSKEVAFYERILLTSQGPILEAMCGSGRLLIPLLKKGLIIDGVDNSSHMLESCQRRCRAQTLNVTLYNQSLQTLALPKKYDIIFIAIGSFQLIYNLQEAKHALKNLLERLLPRGKLILETFVPWDTIKDNIHGPILLDQSKEISIERSVQSSEGFEIVNHSKVTVNFKEQLEKTRTRYEKWVHGKFSYAEEEDYTVRWYHRFEMKYLLENIGFTSVKIIDETFEQNEQAVVYVASVE